MFKDSLLLRIYRYRFKVFTAARAVQARGEDGQDFYQVQGKLLLRGRGLGFVKDNNLNTEYLTDLEQ